MSIWTETWRTVMVALAPIWISCAVGAVAWIIRFELRAAWMRRHTRIVVARLKDELGEGVDDMGEEEEERIPDGRCGQRPLRAQDDGRRAAGDRPYDEEEEVIYR